MPGASRAAIGEEATLGEVVTTAISDGVDRLLANETALLAGDGDRARAVHQMRVATRRLRSDLRTFRAALDRDWAVGLRQELGWLACLLGAARDAEVLCQRLSDRAQQLTPQRADGTAQAQRLTQRADSAAQAQRLALERSEGTAQVMMALASRRDQTHAKLYEALSGDRYRLLHGRLLLAAASPDLKLPGEAGRPAGEALPPLVRRSWGRLEKKVSSLGSSPADEELHEVRIFAKRCRYAAEACAPSLGNRAERVARACKRLQAVLGELNDAAVAERWLRAWEGASPSPAGSAVAQELAAVERLAVRKARVRWPRAWERALAEVPRAD